MAGSSDAPPPRPCRHSKCGRGRGAALGAARPVGVHARHMNIRLAPPKPAVRKISSRPSDFRLFLTSHEPGDHGPTWTRLAALFRAHSTIFAASRKILDAPLGKSRKHAGPSYILQFVPASIHKAARARYPRACRRRARRRPARVVIGSDVGLVTHVTIGATSPAS